MDLTNDYKVKGNFTVAETNLVDIKIAYDVEAVYNSLFVLFNTLPGQRLLLPEYGSDLQQYLFRPVTEGMASVIGEAIKDSVGRWEPRVDMDRITVQPYPDAHMYVIGMEMYIPTLKQSVQFAGKFLQGEGFVRG